MFCILGYRMGLKATKGSTQCFPPHEDSIAATNPTAPPQGNNNLSQMMSDDAVSVGKLYIIVDNLDNNL